MATPAFGLRRHRLAAQPTGRLAYVAAAEHLLDEGELHAVEERRVPLLRPPLGARQRRQIVHRMDPHASRTVSPLVLLPCRWRVENVVPLLAEISSDEA
jgi:hypothetical protein